MSEDTPRTASLVLVLKDAIDGRRQLDRFQLATISELLQRNERELSAAQRSIETLKEELEQARRECERFQSLLHNNQVGSNELGKQLKSAEAKLREVERNAPIAKFGALCFAEHRDELAELDGGWLQEKAVECGLLARQEVTKKRFDLCQSTGHGCVCVIGDTCYFPTELGKRAFAIGDATLAEQGKRG